MLPHPVGPRVGCECGFPSEHRAVTLAAAAPGGRRDCVSLRARQQMAGRGSPSYPPVSYLEVKNVCFQEVFIHVARQRGAVSTYQSCWLTALRAAKGGQQVVLQSLGSVLGNAEPCRVSGCQWDLLACASLQPVYSYLKGRMAFPVAGIGILPVKKENK